MNNELIGKIEQWLENEGYPLEMKVASALRKASYAVNQGSYYNDPETETSREIDIIASKTDDYGILEVSIVIECKKSKEKPWILFTSDEHESGKNKTFTYCILSDLARRKLIDNVIKNIDNTDELNWFNRPKRAAYGGSVVFGSGEDPLYKAILGAIKASIYLNKSHTDISRSLRFIFPVVVLEGKLFEAYLDSSGRITVQEIDEGFVTYSRDISGFPFSSVHLITADRLRQFCYEAEKVFDQIESLLEKDIQKLWTQLTDKVKRR